MNKPILEICIDSFESAVNAIQAQAARLEVCSALAEGGLTPSIGLIKSIRNYLTEINRSNQIELFAMIRPRSGDFVYSDLDVEQMKWEIESLRESVDGFVFGCLLPDGQVDVENCKTLLQLCANRPVTFHRAFDYAFDPFKAIDQLIEIGFRRILTSGQASSAEKGLEKLKKLIAHASNRIIILPGCGIKSSNIALLANELQVQEYHGSASTEISSKMTFKQTSVALSASYIQCDFNEAAKIVQHLNTLNVSLDN